MTVCCCSSDERTADILNRFRLLLQPSGPFHLKTVEFAIEGELGRRSIGRNIAALDTHADIVWFADVDQCFCHGILDRLANMPWPDGAVMIYPRKIKIHREHVMGDKAMSQISGKGLAFIRPSQFCTKKYNRAIGGVQIVQGNFAREHGYLPDDERYQQPVTRPFGDFRDDVAYRQVCSKHGKVLGVDLPGLYRLRHSMTSYQ